MLRRRSYIEIWRRKSIWFSLMVSELLERIIMCVGWLNLCTDWSNRQGSGTKDLINLYNGRNSPEVNKIIVRGGHILTEPIQTDGLDRFGSVSLIKILVSVYWIVNRYYSVWILVWKDFKWIQTDPIQNLHFHTYTKKMYTFIHNSISLTIKTKS